MTKGKGVGETERERIGAINAIICQSIHLEK